MNYSELKIKPSFLGKTLKDHNKEYVLSDDMPERSKRYIYNMITKQVFVHKSDEELESAPVPTKPKEEVKETVVKKTAEVINVPASKPRKRTKKTKANDTNNRTESK